MRLRIADRILVSLAGLLLIAAGAGLAAQLYFQADLLELAVKAFSSDSPQIRWGMTIFAVLLLLLGIYCLFVLFRHRRRKDKFILQKNDNGDLAISIKALENMVQKCVEQHPEIQVQRMYLENRKDGLLIRLRGSIAGGVSIPLTVEAMQKQIRQYVTACSGVEIRGIRVQIESSGEEAENAPFAIAAPAGKPLLKEGEEKQTSVQNQETTEAPQPVSLPTTEQPEVIPETETVSETPIAAPPVDEEDDRPLHQRLFSSQPEACIVPEPPAETEDSAAVEPEPETEIKAEPEDSTEAAEETAEKNSVSEEGPEKTDESAAESVIETEISGEKDTNQELPADEKPEDTAQPAEEKNGADPDFLESLSTFDRIVTGERGQEE